MRWTIFVMLLVLWLLVVVPSYTLGCFIHVLLVVGIVVLLDGDRVIMSPSMPQGRLRQRDMPAGIPPSLRSG